LCRAYRAAFVADKLAGPPRYLDLANHKVFLAAPLTDNGTVVSKFKFKNMAREHLRNTRDQIELTGEGVCADILPTSANQWMDD
jgi:hypothetical protein